MNVTAVNEVIFNISVDTVSVTDPDTCGKEPDAGQLVLRTLVPTAVKYTLKLTLPAELLPLVVPAIVELLSTSVILQLPVKLVASSFFKVPVMVTENPTLGVKFELAKVSEYK